MSLKTYSAFVYGHNITSANEFIDFIEVGTTELSAQITIGSYSLGDFINAVSVAMNEAGARTYTITLNRTTRKITIASTANFQLKVTTGSHGSTNAFALLGFTSNKSGASSYVADVPSGTLYEPQFKLQKFVDFKDNVSTIESSVNTSASGIVEVVSFGEAQFMECNIMYATDILGQGAIKNNANGVANLRNFMNYLIKKYPVEFIPDIEDGSVFHSCILERSPQSGKGTAFMLNELYSRGLANYYETGTLTFREVI
jgi:hypothetical protein